MLFFLITFSAVHVQWLNNNYIVAYTELAMGRRFALTAGLAALMAFSQPAAAQEPLVANAFDRNVSTRTWEDAAATVATHSIGAALYARVQGRDWKQAFAKTAAIRLGMEGAYWVNGGMMSRGNPATTATYLLGQVANSAQVNVMNDKPVLSEVEVNYLLASFRYENQELSVHPNLKPLIGATAYTLSDASFSLERSIASGVLTFTYENPKDTRLNRLLFESRTAPSDDEFVTMHGQGFFDGVVALHVPTEQLANIRQTRDYFQEHLPHSQMSRDADRMLRYSGRNARMAVWGTMAHETLGHQLNHDFHHKLLNAPNTVPVWAGVDVSLPFDQSVRVPTLSAAVAALGYFFPELDFEEKRLSTTHRGSASLPKGLTRTITLYGVPR